MTPPRSASAAPAPFVATFGGYSISTLAGPDGGSLVMVQLDQPAGVVRGIFVVSPDDARRLANSLLEACGDRPTLTVARGSLSRDWDPARD